jgi:phosphonopyruvate hydrolase
MIMASSRPLGKIETLRQGLKDTTRPVLAMAAHNPLGAKLVAEAGFGAVWASGFELSASYGVPDAGILSMDTHLEMTRVMNEAQPLPVVADLDTGFGSAVNVAYVVPKYAAAGAAAVVIEDKDFPKESSLRASTNGDARAARQKLISLEEHAGKIAAAKGAAAMAAALAGSSTPLLVVARTEALIVGLGQEEALRRARAYVDAGADAILIHSKQTSPDEIESFCQAWPAAAADDDGGVPLVIVPTAYPQFSFAQAGALNKIGMVICGNHGVRSAVTAMRQTFARILKDGGLEAVEEQINPVSEIFALQGDAELREIEKRFVR